MSVWLLTAAVYCNKNFVLPEHFGGLACGYGLNELGANSFVRVQDRIQDQDQDRGH